MNSPANSLTQIPRDVLTGIAQIMLQPSPLVGLAFLIGSFLNSPMLALFGVVGCLASTMMAWLCKFPSEERSQGLYGFNGGLIGLGVGYFNAVSLPLLVPVVLGAMVSSLVMYKMMQIGLRPFTFPFVIVTWVIMLILSVTGLASISGWSTPNPTSIDVLESLSRGYGQVLFQENILTGLIFIGAILIRDWVQGLYASMATVMGLLCGYLAGFPIDAVNLGLFGYSAVLCGILFAGRTGRDFINAVIAILLSIAIVRLFHMAGIPPFTFPFVLASWVVLWGCSKFQS